LHRALLPNHPHDARGGLSFLHDVQGAYGYLINVALEDDSLARVAELARAEGRLRFRCAVPDDAAAPGGLTVYGYNSGRYPLCPTLIIEWEQDERRRA
jgi:predicted transcriptional regulator